MKITPGSGIYHAEEKCVADQVYEAPGIVKAMLKVEETRIFWFGRRVRIMSDSNPVGMDITHLVSPFRQVRLTKIRIFDQ